MVRLNFMYDDWPDAPAPAKEERFTVSVDPQTGARYLSITKYQTSGIRETVVVADGINVDLDRDGNVVGVEIL
jgi:uncharacterized protein YuzE